MNKLSSQYAIVHTALVGLGSLALWCVPMLVSAEGVTLDNPIAVETIEGLLRALIGIVIVFATPIIIFFIVYAGFLYVTARGNEQTITQANRALFYAIIGGLLILGAYVLIEIVSNLIESVRTG